MQGKLVLKQILYIILISFCHIVDIVGIFSVFKSAEKWTEVNIYVFLVFPYVENLVVLGGDFEENNCVDDCEE